MSKKNNYKVYVHINKVNGKRYYGITKLKVEKRWANGYGYKFWIDKKGRRHGNKHFWNSICKYGWNEGFEHIVIARGLTEEEAKWLEIELIREWDTTNRDKGYNITKGGESANGLSGKNNHKATKVYCVELDMYFDTITEASEFVGCCRDSISQVLTSRQETAKGYHWVYAEDVNNLAVYIIELDKYFDSINKCAEFLKCSRRIVVNVLYHKLGRYKGYHIIFAKDVEKLDIENKEVS